MGGVPRELEPGYGDDRRTGALHRSRGIGGCTRRWRGIGIRVEDVVLVTRDGVEVLSSSIPKSVEELERHRGVGDHEPGIAAMSRSWVGGLVGATLAAGLRRLAAVGCADRSEAARAQRASRRAKPGPLVRLGPALPDPRTVGRDRTGMRHPSREVHVSRRGGLGFARIRARGVRGGRARLRDFGPDSLERRLSRGPRRRLRLRLRLRCRDRDRERNRLRDRDLSAGAESDPRHRRDGRRARRGCARLGTDGPEGNGHRRRAARGRRRRRGLGGASSGRTSSSRAPLRIMSRSRETSPRSARHRGRAFERFTERGPACTCCPSGKTAAGSCGRCGRRRRASPDLDGPSG